MNAQQANAQYDALLNAIAERETRIHSKDNETAIALLKKGEKAIKKGLVIFPSDVIEKIATAQKVESKATDDFIAVKVNVKIIKALTAFGQGLSAQLDAYSFSIIKNLVELETLDNLNARRSICSRLELDEMQIAQNVKVYHNCSESTAMTQTSSTREMLRALDIAHVVKRQKNNVVSLKDTKQAISLIGLFA